MSDQAIAWKLAFGALVLVFCAFAYIGRKDAPPAAALAAKAAVLPAPTPAPPEPTEPLASAAAPAATAQEPAPVDLPDAQEAPVRIHIALAEPDRDKPAAAPPPRPHRALRHSPPEAKHLVRATHTTQRTRARHVSPYAVGRQHYPFDPRERWRTREG